MKLNKTKTNDIIVWCLAILMSSAIYLSVKTKDKLRDAYLDNEIYLTALLDLKKDYSALQTEHIDLLTVYLIELENKDCLLDSLNTYLEERIKEKKEN